MKTKFYVLLMLFVSAALSCKKDINLPSDEIASAQTNDAMVTQATRKPLTVETIAGAAGRLQDRFSYLDGVGTQARFHAPQGMDLQPDGSIYIADQLSKKIRKISSGNVVSTVNVPVHPRHEFLLPRAVKVAKDGTINILMNEIDTFRKLFIWKPGASQPTVPPYKNTDYHYFDIARDPYSDYFWLCGIKPVYTNGKLTGYNGLIEKLRLDGQGVVGTESFVVPQSALTPINQQTPFVTTMLIGYNKVKYLVIGKNLYKLTPSGVFAQINKDLIPYTIFHVIANKDSQTLYLVLETGGIYALTDGKLKYLVGPNGTENGSDGVGKTADVRAYDLALSKDENTIYFTDYGNSSVRKLYLK
jgi:hypothetical protein